MSAQPRVHLEKLRLRESVRPADEGAVRDLVAATGFFRADEVAIAAELVRERLDRGADSGYEFVFAEEDGALLGYACFGQIPCSSVSWDLYWIAVDPGRQGGGVGRRLLGVVEDRVRAAGGLALYAETSGLARYAPTRGFYARNGFHEAAVFADFYERDDAKVVFLKRLAD